MPTLPDGRIMFKKLVTGGSGLLGTHLKEVLPDAHYPSHSELDITEPLTWDGDLDLVIHCAALKTAVCDKDKQEAMRTNILGTIHVAELCRQKKAKMVYISTDYVFKGDRGNYSPKDEVLPQNYYAETKLAGEYVTKSLDNYLIVRLSFYPEVFPYDRAFIDQYTTRVTVKQAAKMIVESLNKTGIAHLCGKRQTVYEFASLTSKVPILPMYLKDDKFVRPKDTSLVP